MTPFHLGWRVASANFHARPIATSHSTRLDVWMIHVGTDSAFAGSLPHSGSAPTPPSHGVCTSAPPDANTTTADAAASAPSAVAAVRSCVASGGAAGAAAGGGVERVAEPEDDDAIRDREERLGRAVQPVGVGEADAVQLARADRRWDRSQEQGEQKFEAERHALRLGHRGVLEPVQHREPGEERRAEERARQLVRRRADRCGSVRNYGGAGEQGVGAGEHARRGSRARPGCRDQPPHFVARPSELARFRRRRRSSPTCAPRQPATPPRQLTPRPHTAQRTRHPAECCAPHSPRRAPAPRRSACATSRCRSTRWRAWCGCMWPMRTPRRKWTRSSPSSSQR